MLWEIAYGDGKSYSVTTNDAAQQDLFWHVYTQPGAYQPLVTLTDANGMTSSATCDLTYVWDAPLPTGGTGGPGTGGSADCYFEGVPMWGKVQVVDNFADFDVQVVDFFPDLKVQEVTYFPDSCGKWQFVNAFPDFTVHFVDFFPDFSIQFVDFFPGK